MSGKNLSEKSLLEVNSIDLNNAYDNVELIKKVYSINFQIYKIIRCLVRSNPIMRNSLNLDTKDDGIYVSDIMKASINNKILYCDVNGYTLKKCYIIVQELNEFEILMRDILQYHSYFIRSDNKQKPDILLATEKYKDMADKATIDQLRSIVGKEHSIDFDQIEYIEKKNEEMIDMLDCKDDKDLLIDSINTDDSDDA